MEPNQQKQPKDDNIVDKEVTPSEVTATSTNEIQKENFDKDINTNIVKDESKSESPNKEKKKNSVGENVMWRIRTYKEDIAEAIRLQKVSLTSVVAAEQIRRSKITKNYENTKKDIDLKKVSVIIGSVLLFVFGISVITYFIFFYQKDEMIIEQEIPSLIFTEEQKEFDITNRNARRILQELGSEKYNSTLPLGQISYLYVTKTEKVLETEVTRLISAREFLTSINAQVSNSFLRSLENSFMIGIHVFNKNQPFIIFKSNSYQHSFNGLLEWEKVMYQNLSLFMGRKIDPVLGVLTNPQTGKEVILKENFEDIIIKNIDVRALLSEDGDIELLYAFINQQTLVITTNKNTLIEIITRINSVRVF